MGEGCKIGGILQVKMQPNPLTPFPKREGGKKDKEREGRTRGLPLRLSFFRVSCVRAGLKAVWIMMRASNTG